MIDPNWSVVDLDPRTWRNLGKYLDLAQYIRASEPGAHELFVLHEAGRLLKVVDSQRGVRPDFGIPDCKNPRELAQRLFATGEWKRVHIINKSHLAEVARQAQAAPRELAFDAYYHRLYHLLWNGSDGYVCEPPPPGHWNGWAYTDVKQFVDRLPAAATLALGVFDAETVEIGLILEFQSGMIRRLTTFEGLDLPTSTMLYSAKFLDQLWTRLEEKFAPPAGVLLCTLSAFNTWLTTSDKTGYLQRASQEGTAIWKLRQKK